MDWIVDLPIVHVGPVHYNALLVFTDRATKMVHLVPTNKFETAQQTAEYFIKHVVKLHGLPRSWHTDQDRRITSAFWQNVCRLLGIKVRTTAALHPQANGQAERTNQTVKQLLRIATQRGIN